MVDNLSPEKRSKIMRSVRSANTKPELTVRRLLFSMGYRYRLHRKELPGSPDIAFIGRKKAIFVHGCFWHVHSGCYLSHIPKNIFWRKKLAANKKRDRLVQRGLANLGWEWMVVWECELTNIKGVRRKLRNFLGRPQQ